jgi:hypothetical protein
VHCGGGTCSAQLAITGVGTIMGTDARGTVNSLVTTTNAVYAETPSTTAITATSGPSKQSEGRATVLLSDGSAWHVDVDLVSDIAGNVRLTGTAMPAS